MRPQPTCHLSGLQTRTTKSEVWDRVQSNENVAEKRSSCDKKNMAMILNKSTNITIGKLTV